MTDVSEILTLGSAWTPFSAATAAAEPRRFTFERLTPQTVLLAHKTIDITEDGEVILKHNHKSNTGAGELHPLHEELSKSIQDVLSDEMTRLDEVGVANPEVVPNTSSILTCSTCSQQEEEPEQSAAMIHGSAADQLQKVSEPQLTSPTMSDDSSVLHLLEDQSPDGSSINDMSDINRMAVEEEQETIWIERPDDESVDTMPEDEQFHPEQQHYESICSNHHRHSPKLANKVATPKELSAALASLQEFQQRNQAETDDEQEVEDYIPDLEEAPSDELEDRDSSPPKLHTFTKQSLYVRMRCNQRFQFKALKETSSDETTTTTSQMRSKNYFKARYAQERTLRSKESLQSAPSDETDHSHKSTKSHSEKARESQSTTDAKEHPPLEEKGGIFTVQQHQVSASVSKEREECIMTPVNNIPTTRSLQVLDENKLAKLLGFFEEDAELETNDQSPEVMPPLQEEESSPVSNEETEKAKPQQLSPKTVIKTPRAQDEANIQKESDKTDSTATLSLCDTSHATIKAGSSTDILEAVEKPAPLPCGRRRSIIVTNPEILQGDDTVRPHTHMSSTKTPHTIGSFSMLSPSFTEHKDLKNCKGPFFESRKASSPDSNIFSMHEFFNFLSCSGLPPSPSKKSQPHSPVVNKDTRKIADV